jgi:tetratricopeptide (TPR) repeat protein
MRMLTPLLTLTGAVIISASLAASAQETPPESPAAPTLPVELPIDTAMAAPAETTGDPLKEGLSVYQKQDFTAAVSNFEAALRANPESADAYFYLGYALYKLKRFDESRLAFTQAYQLHPDYWPPLVPTTPAVPSP